MKAFWKRFIHTPSVDWDAKKEGWKAALEWLYKEAKELEQHPEAPMDAYDLIEQELEE